MVEFEWDEDKRLANIEKHGVDFRDARVMFDGRPLLTRTSFRDEELRQVTIVVLGERLRTVIWTRRDGRVRIISIRRARDAEEREYCALHG